MFKIEFYVPVDNAEQVKKSMFDAGAGKIGEYDSCCWQSEGTGQFRPLTGSSPAIGEHGRIERVKELKVEMVCRKKYLNAVIDALVTNHPYETPAYGFYEMLTSP